MGLLALALLVAGAKPADGGLSPLLQQGTPRGAAAAANEPSAQASTTRTGEFHASSYLPLGHWAYDYLNVLIARGRLPGLPPLVQPYRRIDIAQAIQDAEAEGRLSPRERTWVKALKPDLSHEFGVSAGGDAPEINLQPEVRVGIKALTHTHRDPLRPQGDDALFPTIGIAAHGNVPGVAGAFRARWDNHYLNDPQFPDGRAIEFRECDPIIDECAYRIEDAYLEVQFPYVSLFVGRMYRNWGLPGAEGFLISDYAYSYDHLGYRFGTRRVSLSGIIAFPHDFQADTARYVSSHRLEWQARDNLAIALGESVVFGGVARSFDLSLVNPLGIWEISGMSGSGERNALGLVEIWWRPKAGLVTYGSFLLDNTTVGEEFKAALSQYGASLGVQLPAVTRTLALRADVSVFSALAYRTRLGPLYYYTIERLGIGRDKSDAVIASLRAEWFARPGLVLRPQLDVMWRGEDDLRQPWPEGALTGRDLLLVGQVQTTLRPGVSGRWHTGRGEVLWDLGVNLVRNDGNVPRDWRSKAVGRIEARLRQAF